MDKMMEIRQLITELNKASDAYYNTGNTIMSDKEFDSKLSKLELLEKETGIIMSNSPTQKVGAPVLTKLDKVTHEFKPMLSLEKVHSAEEIYKFANGKELIAMIKLDGLSVRLTYHYGVLSKAETRGNGIEGSDITLHVKHFENVPLVINNKAESYVVDGEAIITDDDFESINAALPEGTEKFKNSRNLASGTLALLDTSLVKERHLRFVLWDIIAGSNLKDKGFDFEHFLEEAELLGFEVVPFMGHAETIEAINTTNIMVFEKAKYLGYPIDGVVWKFNDVAYGEALGQTSHHFCNAVAYKAKNDEYETVLRDIEWSMGKTGQLTPVAIFDPVEIDGTTVERASLHNLSIMKELFSDAEWYEGLHIFVFKANMIIPQISSVYGNPDDYYASKLLLPVKKCPICGGKTEIVKENDTEVLVCTNDDCKGKLLGKLSHAVSKNALNIDGLSEATLEFMINELGVKSIKDLYVIPFYKEVQEKWKKTPGFGAKSVDKILAAIEKSRNTTLSRFIYAQSIPLIGRTASKDIEKHCKFKVNSFCDIMANDNQMVFLSIDGFGETMLKSLEDWKEKHWIEFLALKSEFEFEEVTETTQNKNVSLTGMTFVITGSLNHFSNREELKEKLESLGAKVSGSVSAKTFALICNEDAGSSKSKKAKTLGVQVWTEEQLLEYIKTNN